MSGKKQAIILRQDLDMSRGKMIAQACHASLKAVEKTPDGELADWKDDGARKIVLDPGYRSLEDIYRDAERNDLPAAMVKDAGKTELEPGTLTAVGIGPADQDKIDRVTGDLKLI